MHAPKHAATALILRQTQEPRDHAPFEVCMIRRSAKSPFMPGVYVFPGGKLEDDDKLLLQRMHSQHRTEVQQEDDALRICALRETLEEAGLWLGPPLPDAQNGHAASPLSLQNALLAGTSLSELCHRHGINICEGLEQTLRPWVTWVTPKAETRRYKTRFYLCHLNTLMPHDHHLPTGQVDKHEATDLCWLSPHEALTQCSQGHIRLAPPTFRCLELLKQYSDIPSALDELVPHHGQIESIEPIKHTLKNAHGNTHIRIIMPGHPQHPQAQRVQDGVICIEKHENTWKSHY